MDAKGIIVSLAGLVNATLQAIESSDVEPLVEKFQTGLEEHEDKLKDTDCSTGIMLKIVDVYNELMDENMTKEIVKHGGKIAGIYYCPHGWDEGCECRKPRPGMFHQAAREHHINLKKTIFIGDDERDVLAGNTAGIKTILVTNESNLLKVVKHKIL